MAVVTSSTGEVERLIASAAAGDEVAFASIVDAHHEDMRRVCVVVIGSEEIADDAVEAAWSKAWVKLGSVRDPARLRAWLVSIAVNEARQLVRSRARRAMVEITVGQLDDMTTEDSASSAIGRIDLRRALEKLDADDRALLAMRYVAGFDATELAYATGRTPSGTRARLARLLDRLEKELGDA
jgi:RNA polymerase sigma-70 factor (ECF subfamily)